MTTTLDTTLYGAPIDECERCESPWPLGDGLYAGLCHDCARDAHESDKADEQLARMKEA